MSSSVSSIGAGFANITSGHITGTQVDLEMGRRSHLATRSTAEAFTFIYDEERGELTLAERRGGRLWFGGTVLARHQT